MTISPWLIYLWGIADELKFSLGFAAFALCIFGGVLFFITLIGQGMSDIHGSPEMSDGTAARIRGYVRRMLKFGIPAFIVSCLIPSSKTIAIMVVLPAIVNSEPIQQDLPELYRIAVDALKEQLQPK
jgi:hypothetical protein